MTVDTARLAYLHALPSGLTVGLPDGRHLLVTAAGVQERTGDAAGTVAHPWGEVTDLAVEARARRVPGVGPALLALSVAAEAIGLGGWVPDAAVAREVTGYERGTITPFGSLRQWPVVADARVPGRAVSVGGGAHGVAATVDGSRLVLALGATVADVTEEE